jgi:hypothetical protein
MVKIEIHIDAGTGVEVSQAPSGEGAQAPPTGAVAAPPTTETTVAGTSEPAGAIDAGRAPSGPHDEALRGETTGPTEVVTIGEATNAGRAAAAPLAASQGAPSVPSMADYAQPEVAALGAPGDGEPAGTAPTIDPTWTAPE